MPDDQLTPSTKFVDYRRAVADSRVMQCTPDFFSGRSMKCHDQRPIDTSDQSDQLVAINQRGCGHSPLWQFCAKIGLKILLPKHLSCGFSEAKQMTNSADRINAPVVN